MYYTGDLNVSHLIVRKRGKTQQKNRFENLFRFLGFFFSLSEGDNLFLIVALWKL